jgi:hypothetical protein
MRRVEVVEAEVLGDVVDFGLDVGLDAVGGVVDEAVWGELGLAMALRGFDHRHGASVVSVRLT